MAETPKEPDGERDVGKPIRGDHAENLQDFLKPLILSESKEETQKAISDLNKDVALEDQRIDKIRSMRIVSIACVILVAGYVLKMLSEVPWGWEVWTIWLVNAGTACNAIATVITAWHSWKCKKYQAMIQLKIDGIDIWEKYPIKMMGNRGRKKNEELRDQRVAYLLKKSYINTMCGA